VTYSLLIAVASNKPSRVRLIRFIPRFEGYFDYGSIFASLLPSLLRSNAFRLVALTAAALKRNAFRQALIGSSRFRTRSSYRSVVESLEPRHLMAAVPFAMDDPSHSTPVSTDLVISSTSQGIVSNDFEIDSAGLVASVVASPSHGSIVSFNSNGTFTYRPTTGYSGTDSFTYKVSNGSVDSNVAIVSLQVGQVFGPRLISTKSHSLTQT